jgi:hypothetical protein
MDTDQELGTGGRLSVVGHTLPRTRWPTLHHPELRL